MMTVSRIIMIREKKDYIWIWCWALVLVMLLPLVDVVNDPILVQKSIEIPWFNAFFSLFVLFLNFFISCSVVYSSVIYT